MKKCTVCTENKTFDQFYKAKTKDGYSFRCKTCSSAYYKGYNASRKVANAKYEVDSKVCRECGLKRPISQFGKKQTSFDKHNIYCKPCWRIRCAKSMKKRYHAKKG